MSTSINEEQPFNSTGSNNSSANLPSMSKDKYMTTYENFLQWKKCCGPGVECILLDKTADIQTQIQTPRIVFNPPSRQLKSFCGLVILVLQMTQASGASRFSSHVTVNTPARSYSHGVGDPLPTSGRRSYQRPQRPSFRVGRRPALQNQGGGYPRVKPSIPFNNEERPQSNLYNVSPWQYNSFQEAPIPVLPPSPYKVDSPDPESLWPEGLFLPPLRPYALASSRRADGSQEISDPLDPYLLEGSEARVAVKRAKDHGLYYFHDIPHIESLLANQEIRLQNNLKPHRLGSIRHTWPYNRP